jgi:hypothetical protein
MTLIIGCITKDFGIIAGDTQLTTKGLEREDRTRKSVELKVSKYSTDFIMGILGKWGYFFTTTKAKGLANYINDYDLLRRGLSRREVVNKEVYLNTFLYEREIIEASAIYVKRNAAGFVLESASNTSKNADLKTINTDDYKMVFNEPFFSTDDTYVNNKIEKLIQEYGLGNTLSDMLFLLNNIILEVISNGRSFTISKNGISYMDVANTVGGYITIQIMTKSGIHYFNYLGSSYNLDINCLLDKTTNPFSNYLDENNIVRYIDNLGMLLRNMKHSHNDDEVKASIVSLIPKQILHIGKLDIIEKSDLNKIIDYINHNYKLGLEHIVLPEVEQVSNDISLANILFDTDEAIKVDINFLLRFL